MTTAASAQQYLAEFLSDHAGRRLAHYNPNDQPIEALPVIYGFNNGGSDDWFHAQLIAQDGTALGSHICSHEGYMAADLGVLEGTRPDRHEGFRMHYPSGYRMEFIRGADVSNHAALKEAFRLNREMGERAKTDVQP